MIPALLLALAPRAPLPPIDTPPTGPLAAPMVLRLKLDDAIAARVGPDGQLRGQVDLADLNARLDAAGLRPVGFGLDPARVEALRERAAARSGVAAPDLGGLLSVPLPVGFDPGPLLADLRADPRVEYAVPVVPAPPPPGDLPPTTPDFTDEQGYLGPDPGLDVVGAQALGLYGDGIALADCEYGWITDHEDLVDKPLPLEPGTTVDADVASYGYDHHGTAVLGELVGVDNGYGVVGMAPNLTVGLFSEYLEGDIWRRPEAIAAAAATLLPGDVLVMEMQAPAYDGANYGPAETDPNVFLVVQTAVSAGLVVVAAAGNGHEDLDAGWYAANYLTWGDSGAILVGAGTPDASHSPETFSTHGARVNLQGWGSQVFTLGYGDAGVVEGDKLQSYTAGFGGTSGATPMVAAAAALVQQQALSLTGAPLDPRTLRDLLVATGIPQGPGDEVGPLPDIVAAARDLDFDEDGFINATWGGDDCEDGDAASHPGGEEEPYDGLDNDCNGGDANDLDGDGSIATEAGGPDCDDADPAIHPGVAEVWYDGVDADCDGNDADADGDGVPQGADCDETDPAVFPGATEQRGNHIDDDCDGRVDEAPAGKGCGGGCANGGGAPALGLALLGLLLSRPRRA